jgi:hypothetical protein
MRTLVFFTLATFLPAQQQCAARNDDNTLVTNTTMGGPNLLFGMRLVAEANYSIAAVQVQTGLLNGPGTMAIYDHDAVNDRPNQNISGTGNYTQCNVISWQGAALPTAIAVTQGQVFWVVWGMPNGSRTPLSTNTVGDVPYRGSFDGGLTWNGQNNGATPWPARPYKLRLFCPYSTQPLQPVGQGKIGTNGVPTIQVTGWPAQGNELDINLKQAAPASPAVHARHVPGSGDRRRLRQPAVHGARHHQRDRWPRHRHRGPTVAHPVARCRWLPARRAVVHPRCTRAQRDRPHRRRAHHDQLTPAAKSDRVRD